jgi:ribosomal-protein-alanine N-acetyltransferase
VKLLVFKRKPMLNLNFTPFPELTTERLILRRLTPDDEQAIFTLRSDKRVIQYINREAFTDMQQARDLIHARNQSISKNQVLVWAISFKNDPSLIGTVCLWNISQENSTIEIGYDLLPEFHGKGIMQEAIASVIDLAFKNLGFKRIVAWTHPQNHPSHKLLKKHNFERDIAEEHKHEGKEYFKNFVIFSRENNFSSHHQL